jgi:imidazolonepropionase-like amidohydrolase
MTMILFRNAAIVDGELPEPRGGCDVLIEGERIREVSDRPIVSAGATTIDLKGRTLMPGLIDAHFHAFAIYLNMWRAEEVPLTLMTAMALERLKGALDRGFTTVRDTAGGDWGIKQAVARGIVTGPRMFISGKGISQTGGHGDMRLRTDDAAPCPCHNAHQFICRIADGNAEVRRAVRDELRKGADQIKIMASGGVGSPNDPIDNRQFSAAEIQEAVDEAEAWNTYVLAHAYTAHAITHAVSNGVRSIEHGNLIDEPAAKLMVERDAFMVPTLVCYQETAEHGDRLGLMQVVMEKLAYVNKAGIQMLETCRRVGVRMGFGTDLMGELHTAQSREFVIRGAVLPAHEVIASATKINAQLLMREAELGCVAPGAYADLLVVEGNPLKDLRLLTEQGAHMSAIMKGGAFYKNRL